MNRWLFIFVIVILIVAGRTGIAAADTAGPTLGNFSPTDGAAITQASSFWLKVTFTATDPDQVDGSSVQMKFNGTSVSSSYLKVAYAEIGHWEEQYDTCTNSIITVWVVDGYDYTKAKIEGQFYVNPQTLPDQNQVFVSVNDKLGQVSSAQWTLTRNTPPVISLLTPVNGTTVSTTRPTISAVLTDINGGINASSISLKMNGSDVEHYFDNSSGTVSYTPATSLPQGRYDITLIVSDLAGNTAVSNWYFYVPDIANDTVGPVLGDFLPLDGSTITETTSSWLTISFSAVDTAQVDGASARIRFNDTYVQSANLTVKYAEIGHWEEQVDTCTGTVMTVWVVDGYDYTQAKIEGQFYVDPVKLPDTNDITVSVGDKLGQVSTAKWTLLRNAPPIISSLTPANGGTTSSALPIISAAVSDGGGINAASIVLKLDGVAVSHVFDSSTGKVSYTPQLPLEPSRHDVSLTVSDVAGNTATENWYFVVPGSAAVFSNQSPQSGTVLTYVNPALSVSVDDKDRIDSQTLQVLVNGIKLPANFTYLKVGGHWETVYDSCTDQTYTVWVDDYDYTNGTITCQTTVLPDGENKVDISIANVYSNKSSTSWSFTVLVPPVISNPAPFDFTNSQTPLISAKISDNGTITQVLMQVNGTDVPATYDSLTKTVSGKPEFPLQDEATHAVDLTVTDEGGLTANLSWSFYVQALEEMPMNGSCTTCHAGYAVPNHRMSNCDGCHSGNAPIEDCRSCHGYYAHDASLISGYTCDYCHSATYGYKIPIHGDLYVTHKTTTAMDSCKPCHAGSLTTEHVKYTDETGANLTCDTCHLSTNEKVKEAIAYQRTGCDACHVIGGTGHAEFHTVSYGERCEGCHGNNMMTENVYHAGNCASCHESSLLRVKDAISLQNRTCFGCHEKAHGVSMAVVREDVPLYSGAHWAKPDSAKVWAGEGWLPAMLNNDLAKVLFSNRGPFDKESIFLYYKNEMSAAGWTLLEESGDSTTFRLLYQKGRRHCLIWLYRGRAPLDIAVGGDSRILLVYN